MTTTLENPLRAGTRLEHTPAPATMVIFGATGDLTHRKLVPALYNLTVDRYLHPNFSVVGFARRDWSDEHFREQMYDGVKEFSRRPVEQPIWEGFSRNLHFHSSNFDDPAGYEALAACLDKLDEERGAEGNRIYYLSTSPNYFPTIVERLGEAGLGGRTRRAGSAYTRILIEKPFGNDLESARALNDQLHQVFSESQIYRIDHYLGKETVQNILVLRFANGIFEPVWNRNYIDHVQITAAEHIGVEGRGGYYDGAGALRDMVQSHLMQLLNLVAMEPPVAFDANAVRDEKVKLVRAIRAIRGNAVAEQVIRGQYGMGRIQGKEVPGYRQEPDVPQDTRTETYAALKLFVDNWRWQGVPFYLRTGKRLPKRVTEIAIEFKQPPHLLFGAQAAGGMEPNVLALRIQPDEGISWKVAVKTPGTRLDIRPVKMEFLYGSSFGEGPPEAYERLLLDALLGDSTLFTRGDEVEASWAFVTDILDAWEQMGSADIATYEAGSWGPREADRMLYRDDREWRWP
jgi:glucose-6-phosphate 1-dehydrogenase